jgi:hypothetical protein
MKYDKQIADLVRKDIILEQEGISSNDKARKKILNQIGQLYFLQQREENECVCKNNQG